MSDGASVSVGEHLTCAVCQEICYKVVSGIPCLHNLCAACWSQSLRHSSECPVCRTEVTELRRNHVLHAVIDEFLRTNTGKRRSAEEMAQMDSMSTITDESLRVEPKRRRVDEPEQPGQEQGGFPAWEDQGSDAGHSGGGHDWDDQCSGCGDGGGEMLCCEAHACRRVMHVTCASLASVPEERWICPWCVLRRVGAMGRAGAAPRARQRLRVQEPMLPPQPSFVEEAPRPAAAPRKRRARRRRWVRVQQPSRSSGPDLEPSSGSDSASDDDDDADYDVDPNKTAAGETTVTFSAPGPLGLSFAPGDDWIIRGFKPETQASAHEAVQAGTLRVRDHLVRIGAHDILGLSDREVLKLIRKAGRPLALTFRRASSGEVVSGDRPRP